jgi:protease-4
VIVAEPGTVTGSIGVYTGKINLSGLYDKLGIEREVLKRGKNSDFYTTYAGFTDEQKKIVNRQLQEMYHEFISKIAQGRSMTQEAVETIAQGRVWTGRQARDNGLVDELGGLQLAISIARSKAGLKPDENVDIVAFPKRASIWHRLGDTLFSGRASGFTTLPEIVKVTERFANDKMFFLVPYTINCE